MGRVVACLTLIVALLPRSSEACEPYCPKINLIPPPGSILPANAGVRFEEWPSLPKELQMTATVDGAPIGFEVVPELGGTHRPLSICREAVAYRITTPAQPGGELIVNDWEGFPTWFYTLGDPDLVPPAALKDIVVDVHDYEVESVTDCALGFTATYWVSLVGGAQDSGSPVFHTLFLNDDDGDDGKPIVTVLAGTAAPVPLPVRQAWIDAHDLVSGFCITARTFDLAGNEAATGRRACAVCRARIEVGIPIWDPPGVTKEPAWTDADVVPKGQCMSWAVPPLPETMESSSGGSSGDEASSGGAGLSSGSHTSGGSGDGSASTGATGSTSSSTSTSGASSTSEPMTGGSPVATTTTGVATGLTDGPVEHGCACDGGQEGGGWLGLVWLVASAPCGRRRGARTG